MKIGYGDILLDQSGDIKTENGDIVVGDGIVQQIGGIINAQSGNFRKWPTLGANIADFLDGVNDSRDIAAAVNEALESDGFRLLSLNQEAELNALKLTVNDAEKTTDNTTSLL